MALDIYKTAVVHTVDGLRLEISPLKIKYLKEFISTFAKMKDVEDGDDSVDCLLDCARVCMKQFAPHLSNTINDISDNFDMQSVYEILDFAAGVKINKEVLEETPKTTDTTEEKVTWDDIDLVKLETEVFLVGVWKNFEELEISMSLPEIMAIISMNRELSYDEKKFMAAMQGIDLDAETGQGNAQQEWENLKAKVASGGKATDSKDILALQGQNAKTLGFGIGLGLSYAVENDSTSKPLDPL